MRHARQMLAIVYHQNNMFDFRKQCQLFFRLQYLTDFNTNYIFMLLLIKLL